jgi:hypothetical protein
VFLDTAVTLAGAFPEQALSLADDLFQDITADEDDSGFGEYMDEYLARIAKVKALAGHWDQAQDIARGIASLNDRATAFADIATAAIAANRADRFTGAREAIPPEFLGHQARITATMAGTFADAIPELAAEWAAAAELLARHTTNPASSLITAAEALHDALTSQKVSPGHPLRQRARRMLALALAEEGIEWISAMPVLGKFAPSAVRASYDKLITLRTSPA